MFSLLPKLALVAGFAATSISALPRVSVKGAKFFADGQQFFIKGVAYQGTPADPLVDTNQCTMDAELMSTIGTNSIRVYHVDPAASHDGCMAAFAAKGIYVWLDLDTFSTYIIQTDPYWTQEQFGAYTAVMDSFAHYDNLGGFWIGNEIINTADGSIAAPYIKAAVADMKSYMATKNYGSIPIGYSAADIAQLRPELQNYLACGDYSTSIDFFGLNAYEWCGSATYDTSGYSNLQAMAEGYSVPIFFSETGCNVGGERTFADQAAIFGPDMIDTWSGSIIYEWVQEENDYGLVSYPNGQIYNGPPTAIQPDFDNLAGQWKNINPTGIAEGAYTPSFSAPACPGPSNGWLINGAVPIPTLGAAMVNSEATSTKPTPVPSSVTYASVSSSTDTQADPSTSPSATLTTSDAQGGSSSDMSSSIPSTFSSQISSGFPSSTGSSSAISGSQTSSYTTSSTSHPATPKSSRSSKLSASASVTTMALIVVMDGASTTTTRLSYTGFDLTSKTGSSGASPTATNDVSKTSPSPSATSSGAATNLGTPAGIASGILGLFVVAFL